MKSRQILCVLILSVNDLMFFQSCENSKFDTRYLNVYKLVGV